MTTYLDHATRFQSTGAAIGTFLQARLGSRQRPVAVAAAVLAIVGAIGPWAGFSGFAGKMTLLLFNAGSGGARLYVLLLALGALAFTFVDLPGRRTAGALLAAGALIITGITVFAIGYVGGGAVNIAWGGWVALVGTAVLTAAMLALPDDEPVRELPRLPDAVELILIALLLAGLLGVVVLGLSIESASQFLSLLVLLTIAAVAASKLGLNEWVSGVNERHGRVVLLAALITAVAFPLTQDGDAYYLRVAASIGVFAAAAIGLNIVVGLAGLLDLGYIAFFGVGAYVGALFSDAALTTLNVHLPFLLVVVMGALIAAVFGIIIGAPTLRLRGDYLAIVTLGFGEIFRIAANNLNGQSGPNVTRGPNGIAGIPDLSIGGFNFGESHDLFGISLPGFANYYYAELVLLIFVVLIFMRLNDSRIGRAWVAIREDETAATAMGINTIRLKLMAFAIGAFLAGAAGTVNAHVARQVSPDSYTFLESIFLLAAVVLGGMGTIPGALLGSTILILLPEKLRFIDDKRLLIFGLALVVMMRLRPEGLLANRRRQREFHEEAEPAVGDASGAPPGTDVSGGVATVKP